ncbi:hypothetical protein ACQ4M4_01710 [Leptolyngbya sp. AN02str]|uniref:hypothetical protein n=1 Tax=Leptolyngbya sp. AN02str TaxID=3423363 RepID=UPI003D316FA6
MPDSHTEAAFSRICSIEWRKVKNPSKLAFDSQVVLMMEFIRRQALWGRTLSIPETIRVPFDVAEYKEPTIRANPEILNKLRHHLTKFKTLSYTLNEHAQNVCELELHWAALKDSGIAGTTEHPEPYEPLLYMFDNFGAFGITHDGINVGVSISRTYWLRNVDKPPFWLEEEGFNTSLYPGKGN